MTDPSTDHDDAGRPADLTLSKEVLRVGTEWTVSGSVRMRRHIITETQTVQVTLRREELQIEVHDIDHSPAGALIGTRVTGAAADAPRQKPPLVIVLQQEVPQIGVQLVPYEKVTVATRLVSRSAQVHSELRHEELQLDVSPSESNTPPSLSPRS